MNLKQCKACWGFH